MKMTNDIKSFDNWKARVKHCDFRIHFAKQAQAIACLLANFSQIDILASKMDLGFLRDAIDPVHHNVWLLFTVELLTIENGEQGTDFLALCLIHLCN